MHAVFSRSAVAVATLALAGSALAFSAPAAQAAPVFTDAETHLDPYSGGYAYDLAGDDCDYTVTGGDEPDVPVVENGPAASFTTTASTTFTSSTQAGDTATGTASASGTGKVTSAAGSVSTIDLSVTSSAQLTNALGTSANCNRQAYAGGELEFQFTVAQPGFLQLTTKNTGNVYGQVYLERLVTSGDDDSYVSFYGNGVKFNATTKVFLPAGTYAGSFEGEAYRASTSSSSVSGTTTVHGEFHVAGSQTAAVSGKGKKYVTLPSARSCATHVAALEVTDKKKRAAKVKQVKVFVNDAKAKKVRTPDKGDVINVAIADDVTADVRAEVTLFPAKKGKKAKSYTVSASYEACS